MTELPEPARARPPRRWPLVVLATLLALIAFAAVFDWTWCRPLVRYYVREHAGRAIDFEHLRIGLAPDLSLRVEFRGLHIENAAWAAQRPFIDAGTVRADIAWRSFTGPHVIVTRAVLIDAQVDMERQADGLRNWRLSKPLDRGPGKVRVLALEATRSTIHVIDEGRALSAELKFEPLTATPLPTPLAATPLPVPTRRLAITGRYQGRTFDADVAIGDVISFRDTGIACALRGELRSGELRLRFDGHAADIQQGAALDLELRLSTASAPATSHPPHSGAAALPLTASAHLVTAGGRWSFGALSARLGRTDLRGHAQLDESDADHARVRVSASLRSAVWHLDELAALAARSGGGGGAGRAGGGGGASGDGGAGTGGSGAGPPGWPAVDATLDWQVDKLAHPALPWLHALQLGASLQQGQLAVRPVVLLAAPGRAEATLTLDTTARPLAVALAADVSGVQVGQWTNALSGILQGHVALHARADSWAALARAAAGSATFTLRDASISNRLDARLALDGGAVLAAQFTQARRVPMTCARLAAQVAAGRVTVRKLVAETDRAVFVGSGVLNPADRTVDLVITPHRKTTALFALNRAIRVSGPLGQPRVAAQEAPAATTPVSCATAG